MSEIQSPYKIELYTIDKKELWDHFIENSKNGTFLLKRDYMDYHSNRFKDYSVMFFKKNKLSAVLPANLKESVLYSHQGLTYGGMILSQKVTTIDVICFFELLNNFLKSKNIQKLIYKTIPHIYHKKTAEEDLYAIFRTSSFKLIGRNISSTIKQTDEKIRFSELRRRGLKKALKSGLKVMKSNDYKSFWKILTDNLEARYNKPPVHSLKEIELLANRFQENIKLFLTIDKENQIQAGVVLYICSEVVHVQYISASSEGKEFGALDLLFDYLINDKYANYPYFDFGQSTEDNGNFLNQSLIFQKEGFGARGVVYDIYEIEY